MFRRPVRQTLCAATRRAPTSVLGPGPLAGRVLRRCLAACSPAGILDPQGPIAAAQRLLLLASCKQAGILDPQGPVAAAERLLLINSTAIMLVVVVPVIVATLAFAWWYRAVQPARRPRSRSGL